VDSCVPTEDELGDCGGVRSMFDIVVGIRMVVDKYASGHEEVA
jgi:hypothetical protein